MGKTDAVSVNRDSVEPEQKQQQITTTNEWNGVVLIINQIVQLSGVYILLPHDAILCDGIQHFRITPLKTDTFRVPCRPICFPDLHHRYKLKVNEKIVLHPTFGLWPVNLRNDLRTSLGLGVRKVVHWTERHNHVEALFDIELGDPFFNVNTSADLDLARRIINREVK